MTKLHTAPRDLKVGDMFCATQGQRSADLWCHVKSIKNDVIHAEVLNGYWDIKFDRNTGMSHVEEDLPMTFSIDFTGPWKGVARGPDDDYNIVLLRVRCVMEGREYDDAIALTPAETRAFSDQGEPWIAMPESQFERLKSFLNERLSDADYADLQNLGITKTPIDKPFEVSTETMFEMDEEDLEDQPRFR